MIKLTDIANTSFIQWLRKTTIPQKIALGAGIVLVIGILSYGGYTVYGNANKDITPITQDQSTVKVSETTPAVTAPVVAEAVAPAVTEAVAPVVAIEPSPGVESNATTYEVTSTEGVDYSYDTVNGGRSEYVEETTSYSEPESTYYEPEPTYSEPAPVYSAPEPTYSAPVATAPYDEWANIPQGDPSGDWGAGAISN